MRVRPFFLKRSFLVGAVAFWIAALVIGSLLPQQAKVALGISTPEGQEFTRRTVWTHRLVHYAAFGSTALLLIAITREGRQRQAALLAVIALAVGIEALQHFIYRNDFETDDARIDAFAACAAYVIWHVVRLARQGLTKSRWT